MRILEYFFAALGACLAAFWGYVVLSGATHFNLYPGAYALFFGLAVAYMVFRAWLDHKIAPGRKFPTAAESVAIGAFVCFVIGGVWMGRTHSTPRMQRSSTYGGPSLLAASPATMMDLFMEAHRYLLANGFKPTSQPLSPFMGDVSGLITPDMTGINYIGSYEGSTPFVFRLDIHRDGNQFIANVEQEGATEEKYEAQVKATKEFLDQFYKTMNESKNAQPLPAGG